MDIQLRRVSGDYIDCQVSHETTKIDIGFLDHKEALAFKEALLEAVADLDNFLGIEAEKPTVIITMDDGHFSHVQASCEMTAILVEPMQGHLSINKTPEGKSAFIYETSCEALERKSIQQWAAIVA